MIEGLPKGKKKSNIGNFCMQMNRKFNFESNIIGEIY